MHTHLLICSIRIYVIRILRLEFAKFKEYFKRKLEAENLKRTLSCLKIS